MINDINAHARVEIVRTNRALDGAREKRIVT